MEQRRTAAVGDEQRCGAVTRILLVEDDETLARTTERLLRRSIDALEVRVARTAEVAILLLSHPELGGGVDLVISDWNLAGARHGGDVRDFVRSMSAPPAFLFLSSEEALIAVTGESYLVKPCPPRELREAVLSLIDPPKTVVDMPIEGCA
jgi:DNA-binding response OmpR family regulator